MAGVAFGVEGDGFGFATESYAASALYATLANLLAALWRIRRASDRRLAALPTVPTVAEAGVSDYAINGWYGIIGPANLPLDVTSKLNRTIKECLKDPELVARLEQEGEEVVGGTPAQFAQSLGADLRKYETIVAGSGLQPQ